MSIYYHYQSLNLPTNSAEQWSADLQPSGICLKIYTGQTIPIVGCATVQARYEKRQVAGVAQVVTGDGPNLLGRGLASKTGGGPGLYSCNGVR